MTRREEPGPAAVQEPSEPKNQPRDPEAEAFRGALQARRRGLAKTLSGMREGALGLSQKDALSELSSYDNHPGDLGTDTWQRSQGFALMEELSRTLQEVDAALGRLDTREYGRCERCGRPIPTERLEAIPETRYCVTCREALDAQEAKDPHPRPIEEALLSPPFGRTFMDGEDQTGFDGEDAWQAVAQFGSSDTPSDVPEAHDYPYIVLDPNERHGAVEDVENEVAADGEPIAGVEEHDW